MAEQFHQPIDMQGLEIWNLRLQNLAGAPSGGAIGPGSVYFDTVSGRFMWRATNAWVDALKRESHEGSQTADTISDLPTVMRAVRLDEFAAPTTALVLNGQRLTGVADGTAVGDATNRGQLDTLATTLRGEFADAVDAASKTLDEIDAPVAAVDLNGQKLVNLAAGTAPAEAINLGQLDALATTLRGETTDAVDALAARTLNQIPTATGNVAIGGFKLTALADGTAAGDAINRGQLDTLATTLRSETTDAVDALTTTTDELAARTLDEIPAPAAAVAFNTQKLTGLADGTAAGDAINRGQLDAQATTLRGETTALAGTLRGETSAAITALTNDLNGRSLEDFGAPTSALDLGGQRIVNLADGVNPTDGATVRQLEAAKAQLDWKDAVRVAVTTNIALSGLQTIGGITLTDGQRVLAAGQTDATARLIYLARTGAWEVAPDSVQGALTGGAYVPVMEGAHAGMKFRLATPDPITVGTTALDWQVADVATSYAADNTTIQLVNGVFSIKAGAVARKMEGVLGDGVATTFAATHNFGTKAVTIEVWDATTGDTVICGRRRSSDNVVTFTFANPPPNAGFGYTIQG